jgi:hypothetical protein
LPMWRTAFDPIEQLIRGCRGNGQGSRAMSLRVSYDGVLTAQKVDAGISIE